MKINCKILGIIAFLLISCNKVENNYSITNHFNDDSSTTIYLLKNNIKIDSLKVDDYYGKDSIRILQKKEWNFIYSSRCGSGCSVKKQVVLAVKDDSLKEKLHIQAEYYESIVGDLSHKKYFKRIISIKSNNNNLVITKTCIKNDSKYFLKSENLTFDETKNIYFNYKFKFENKIYKGVKIDSSEYIFYKKKWYEFSEKEQKLYHRF
ncbi:hypothetical protein EYY60_02835 [Flavobacterium zhairuonense]|uniref:hypothetical protein n=1 Tax=Flavobacterium zhairuonense TaxID=2493631 RepID=UPI00104B111E|nr:hypothetical protein [Flavobacterium zhairuonense]KAF2515010.1 hypothetical protein EYY60_02835 [Flavobacterium zhairuonense]